MAIVLDKSHRWRLIAAHVFLLCLCAVVIFPFLMILSILPYAVTRESHAENLRKLGG